MSTLRRAIGVLRVTHQALSSAGPTRLGIAGESAADLQQQLRIVEAFTKAIACSARSQFNTTLPVARLPADILFIIFGMVKDTLVSAPGMFGAYISPKCSYRLLPVTQVCRHWRRVAWSIASLWDSFVVERCPSRLECGHFGHHLKFAGLALARFPTILLDVRIKADIASLERSTSSAEFTALLPHARRLYLTSQGVSRDSRTFVVGGHAPRLQVFSLVHDSAGGRRGGQDLSLPIGAYMFGGKLPELRSLELQGVRDWTGYSFGNLRQLSLRRASVDASSGFLDVLRGNRHLQDMMLSDCSTSSAAVSVPAEHRETERIPLPALKHLCLETSRRFPNLLHHIHISTNMSLSLKLNKPTPHDVLARNAFQEVARTQEKSMKLRRLHLHLSLNDAGRNIVSGQVDAYGVGGGSALYVSHPIIHSLGNCFEMLMDALVGAVDDLEELSLGGRTWLGATFRDSLAGFLRGLSSITKLVLGSGYFVEHVSILAPLSGFIPCPVLRELYICGLSEASCAALLVVLDERRRVGYPIEEVRIYLGEYSSHREWREFGRAHGAPTTEYQWKTQFCARVPKLVERVEFLQGQPPHMELIPICTRTSTEAWDWPAWDLTYL